MATGSPWTVQTIINHALGLIGVKSTGETLSAPESNDALATLNLMLNSWSGRGVSARAKLEYTASLVSNQAVYTIGSSGTPDFSTIRPVEILACQVEYVADTVILPVSVTGEQQYGLFGDRNVLTGPPTNVYYNPTMPNGTLNFYPIPDQTYTLHLWYWTPLQEMALLSTEFTLEPVYIECIMYNLAVRLAPYYERSASPDVKLEAERLFNVLLRLARQDAFITPDYQPIRKPVNSIYVIE
jgi:hypothetical protein